MSGSQVKKKHEEILELIGQFREHPCLWDNNVDESKSISARKMALGEIAEYMNAASEDVRRKLHNLRSQYRRETIRMRRRKTTRPKWLYYNSLKFLSKSIKIREDVENNVNSTQHSKKNKTANEQERGSTENDSEVDEENMIFDDSQYQSNAVDTENQNKSFDIRRHNTFVSRDGVTNVTHAQKTGNKGVFVISRNSTELRDEYEVFGENVANELRSLQNNKNLQQALKCAILQAILDVNKATFDDSTTVQDTAGLDDELNMEEYYTK